MEEDVMVNEPNRRDFMKCLACASLGLAGAGFGCAERKTASKNEKEREDEMKEMIAYCGIPCHACGALIATQNNDDAKRKEVAELWASQYNIDVKPEDINCDGCLSEGGVLFSHCNVCEIRHCARETKQVHCAHCDDYPCTKLTEFFKMVPDAQKTLDGIRQGLT